MALVVLERERRLNRLATPAEIFQCAQSLAERPFPHRYPARAPEEVELFVRWSVAPILMPHVMLVFTDRSGEVFRYQLLSSRTPADILHRVTDIPTPIEEVERVWIVAVYRTSFPSEETFKQALLGEIERRHCSFAHYLAVKADRRPTSSANQSIQQTFICSAKRGFQPATAQEIVDTAQVMSTHSLERGQIISNAKHLGERIQLCAPPLKGPSLEMVFMDDQRCLRHYHKFACRIGELPAQVKEVLADNDNTLGRTGRTVVLVVCMNGPRVALGEQELSVFRRTFTKLAELAISLECVAVVGTDGLTFYWPSSGDSSPSAAAEAR